MEESKIPYTEIEIQNIQVVDRIREDMGDIEDLMLSISINGLFNPILVTSLPDGKYKLVAGGRRLAAFKALQKTKVPCIFWKDLSEIQQQTIELEENIKRKELHWTEEAKALKRLHELKIKEIGKTKAGHGGGWGLADTALELERTTSSIAQDLQVADALEKYPELAQEKNKSAAYRKLQNIKEKDMEKEMASRLKIEVGEHALILGRAELKMKEIAAESVDLIVMDPPWGVDITESQQGQDWDSKGLGKGFQDGKYETFEMFSQVAGECYRVLKMDTHLYCFFGIQFYSEMKKILEQSGFFVQPVPLIWAKGSGGQAGTEYQYTKSYEPILYCLKGKRPLQVIGKTDTFEVERVPAQNKIHPTEKPRRLLRILIEQSSRPGDIVLDPFMGSASTVLAAFESQRKGMGIEMDEKYYNSSLVALHRFMEERK